jgi:lytic murein transglycosylase
MLRLTPFIICAFGLTLPIAGVAQTNTGQDQPVLMATLSVDQSIRPVARGRAPQITQRTANDAGFERWLQGFYRRAQNQGITRATLDQAFAGVRPDPDIIARDRNQAEFTRSLWDYLDSAVSDTRVRNGRRALERHGSILRQIEQRFQVEAEVVVAVWGLETAYGEIRGREDVIRSMATLAYDGRRRSFFEAQLIAALEILQDGDVAPRNMTGSWAGAMGHTQFMPTSYLEYAVDATGDGRRDIWSDNPTDALASTANYLARFGWTYGQPWGVEVILPNGFDYGLTGENVERDARFWNNQGVRLTNGRRVPNHGDASILVPAGAQGVALMIFDNFHVIERYNPADAYVIGVGHLSDRITGGRDFQASWPRNERPLNRAERRELQQRLTNAGYSTGGVDGVIGPNTQQAIRRYQAANGLTPDGFASSSLLQRLR